MKKTSQEWTLSNIPPKGHEDVGDFAYSLFEIARKEKERLSVPQIALRNYAMYRGQKQENTAKGQDNLYPANLYFANIERTVSNITARDPVGEVVDMDGETDDAEKVLTAKLEKWWKDTGQRTKTRISAKLMEVYGITIEKPFFDFERRYDADVELVDMFGFFPAPGLWEHFDEDAPYICFAYVDFLDSIEAKFGVDGILADEAYDLLGQEREKYKSSAGPDDGSTIGRYATPMIPAETDKAQSTDKKLERCLVIEVWIRDNSKRKVDALTVDESGEIVDGKLDEPVYPDGVRKITVTRADGKVTKGNKGFLVLDDSANPNINPNLDVDKAKYTHPWGRFPVYAANSYKDPMSVWGFAAAEQTGYMLYYINQILRKLINWTKNVMTPPLIVQKHCGITRQMIETNNEQGGRLVLMPSIPNARIEFMPIPNLPVSFFQVLDKIIQLHDRIHAIEEADRGEVPNGVIAAQAIVALQEKNQIALQPKTVSIESLVENRSKWAIGLWQNWGTDSDFVNVSGQPKEFVGVDYAGRKFNFVVESGSTTPRTSLQMQELTMNLAQQGKISTRYLLETLNLPGWQQEVARTSGPLVEQAMGILQDAGAPPEALQQLYQMIQEAAMMQEEQPSVRDMANKKQEGGNQNAAV